MWGLDPYGAGGGARPKAAADAAASGDLRADHGSRDRGPPRGAWPGHGRREARVCSSDARGGNFILSTPAWETSWAE